VEAGGEDDEAFFGIVIIRGVEAFPNAGSGLFVFVHLRISLQTTQGKHRRG